MYEVISLMARAKSLAEKFSEACSLNPEDVSTPKLKRIIETLNDKDDLIKSAASLSQEVARLIDTRTLELFIFVCENYEEEFLATRAIMAITGAKVSTDGHVNLRLRRIKDKTSKLFDGKMIRKNQIVEKFQRSKAFTRAFRILCHVKNSTASSHYSVAHQNKWLTATMSNSSSGWALSISPVRSSAPDKAVSTDCFH